MSKQEFEKFYRSTLPYLTGHLRSLGIRQKSELEDIVQDAYIEAFKSIHGLKDEKKARSWLLTIGRRCAGKHFARKDIEREKISTDTELDMIETSNLDSEKTFLKNESLSFIMEEMSTLTPEEKKLAIKLFFIEGYSLQEVAKKVIIKISTLTTWIHRFRRKIQDMFIKYENDPDFSYFKSVKALKSRRERV